MGGGSRTRKPKKSKVLFVCIGNSCRSPIAEALARHLATDVIEASSAGTAALGTIAEQTTKVLAQRGVRMDGQSSRQLRPEHCRAADLVINMSGRPLAAEFGAEAAKVEDWNVRDPYFADVETYNAICDDIERRVTKLAERLRRGQAPSRKNAGPAQHSGD